MDILVERVDISDVSIWKRKRVGMIAQRFLENKQVPGTVEGLCSVLKAYINECQDSRDRLAASWLLARAKLDPTHIRDHIFELMYSA